MKIWTVTFCLILSTMSQAQELYDINQIQTIKVEFEQSNWDALMDAQKAGDEDYIMAKSVSINGIKFDSVGVKYKGNSTYRSNQVKNPWHIELDTYKDQEYQGYTDIKLANGAKDPSFLRDVLGYYILRQYMDAPLANYANLYVNDELIGLYANTESISKKFVNKNFRSKDNTFVKCNPPDGAGPQTTVFPNLVYLGDNINSYKSAYELKSDNGWEELINLCDTLRNHEESVHQILDIDRALWMLAFDNVIVNLDSYIGRFAQNYYLYRDDYARFIPVVWDLNESFGVFSQTGTINLNSTQAKQSMTHLLHETDANFPLVTKLLANPTYKRMYLAHFKTILLENFNDDSYFEMALSLQTLIEESFQLDQNKFFSFDEFKSNLVSDIRGGGGPGGGSTYPGITNLMDERVNYLLGLDDLTTSEPEINEVMLSNKKPGINEVLNISAKVANALTVTLAYRNGINKEPFQKINMFDDGMHNDGQANDGIFGASIDIKSRNTQYYIYAENENIGKFSPLRAEHEFYQIEADLITSKDVVINEFMASNDSYKADQEGEFDDWIELYNNSEDDIDLSGYYLSDDESEHMKWSFPDGTTIDAKGYLIIWADKDEDQEGIHADFKLSANAESVVLSDPNGIIVDFISFENQSTDISYGRFPNGVGDFQTMSPSFNAENTGTSSNYPVDIKQVKVFPNPSSGQVNIVADQLIKSISVHSIHGAKVFNQNYNSMTSITDLSGLHNGVYVIFVELENSIHSQKLIISH